MSESDAEFLLAFVNRVGARDDERTRLEAIAARLSSADRNHVPGLYENEYPSAESLPRAMYADRKGDKGGPR